MRLSVLIVVLLIGVTVLEAAPSVKRAKWKPKAIREKEAAEAKAAAEEAAKAEEEAKKAEQVKSVETSSKEEDKSVAKAVTATDFSEDKTVDAVVVDVATDAVSVTVKEEKIKKPVVSSEPELAKVEQTTEQESDKVTADTVAADAEPTVQVAAQVVVVAADPVAVPAVEKTVQVEALVVEEPVAV